MSDRPFNIGVLAQATGVTAPTIRYYEDIGLLPRAARSDAGQRVYTDTDLRRLAFIRRCRDFGFSIKQVERLVGLSISADGDCSEACDIAQTHLAEVRAKLAELRELETSLEAFVDQCEASCTGGPGRECVVFDEIARTEGDRVAMKTSTK